ncbi:MAG: DUF11 domain-containing protein [Desulfuromonas sp.]|nr:DUF11 domain-containing protein [Desulfuromonas sp.]
MVLRLTQHFPRMTGSLGRRLLAAVDGFVRPGTCQTDHLLQPGRSAGRASGRSARRPEFMETFRDLGRTLGLALTLLPSLAGLASIALAATPPGTLINNQAMIGYVVQGVTQPPVTTNTVTLNVRSPATIEFLTYAPIRADKEAVTVPVTEYRTGSTFNPIPAPPETAVQPVPLVPVDYYHAGNPIYIRLTDLDQNSSPATQQTVLATIRSLKADGTVIDTEVLRLTENALSSGTFTGYLLSANAGAATADGILLLEPNCHIEATYVDAFDGTDNQAYDDALVDPYGYLFDSATGAPVKAKVTLIDLATGLPATTIQGDNGAPNFPASIITGESFIFGGLPYDNPEGAFRFPLVPAGRYQLVITEADGYTVPSSTSEAQLQNRSWWGASGYITGTGWENGRWTGNFEVNPGPAIRLDVPLDPLNSYLWLQKDVSRDVAATGDFLKYTLKLENGNASAAATGVALSARLPLGFRYQKGSARIAGSKVADPAIGSDGRVLTFSLGNVPPASSIEATYVVEVAAGAKAGKAVNSARATDANGISSNTANETVTVRDEFFRNAAILVGRVLEGACGTEDTGMQGVPGVRVYLEDGSFVVTDKDGKYHFEGVTPGLHVVQVDMLTLPTGYEMIPCEQSSQFAGRTFSQFVDLKGGTLWRLNFYTAPKPPPVGTAGLALTTKLDGRQATLTVDLSAVNVPIGNLRATVMLPVGARYLSGTAARDGEAIDDPQTFDETVIFRFPALEADRHSVITFRVDLTGTKELGEMLAKALLTFDAPAAKNQRTPLAEVRFQGISQESTTSEEIRLFPRFPSFVAELQETDLAMLDQLVGQLKAKRIARIDLVGHADLQEIAPRSQHIFADNQALSVARARSVADFLKARLAIPDEAISVRGMGDTLPLVDNATEAGRAQNRRVELFVVSEKVDHREELIVTQPSSPEQVTATSGITPQGIPAPVRKSLPPPAATPPKLDQELLSTVKRERSIVWPAEGFVPEIPNIEVMVEFQRGEQVSLILNDEPVPTLNFDESKPVPNSSMMISSWAGVDLNNGRNRLAAVITDADGKETASLQRDLWFVTTAEKLEYFPEKSRLIADGLQAPTFAVRLTDRDGHPLAPKQRVQFRVSPPYTALHDGAEDLTLDPTNGQGTFEAGADGLAYLQLQPTAQAGEAKVSVLLPDGPQEIKAWLKPAARDWILVGFAEGTVGYNTINDNQVSAAEAGVEEHSYSDGQVKFFAKGAIKGEWLLTLAYDSEKPDLDGDSLYQIIDPETYYPLYGDETQQGYEASSAEKLYVKLERDQFYALFGDMETGLTQAELSQYNRNLNGFKSEMQSERFAYTVFAADTKQSFVKEELRGDGTAGRYALDSNELVINSETVVIETRDRFHNEIIVKEEPLSRHVDYDIDYDEGTLYFKRPVPSKDENFNPIFIVVRYETLSSGKKNLNYGGRAAVKLFDQKVEIGGSLVHEKSGEEKGDLYGSDVTVQLTPQTSVHAEVAATDVKQTDDARKGDAYLAEVEHRGEKLDGRVWFRQQDAEFGLGQQNSGTNGMRTYGAEGSYRFNPQWTLSGEAYHEDNLTTDAKRDVENAEISYRAERYGLLAGVREARDKFEDGEKQTSRQMLLGGDWSTADRKLTLRTTHEQSLGNNNDNSDFPTRTMIGADYQVTRNVSLFAEQEFTWGEQEDTEGTRIGLKATPWQGGEVHTAVERQAIENGERVFALFGIGQNWQLAQRWSIDLSVDRSYTIKNKPAGERINPDVPAASGGDDDFTAVSVGAAYKAEKWSWWNRLETRQGETEDKVGVSSGVVGEIREGTAVSAKLMAFITDSAGGSKRDEEEITLGMAYRPNRSKWIILERLDLSLANEDGDGTGSDSWRIVNHIHANYRASRQWQMSFYYGFKYVRENFDGDRYDGYTDMIAIETRYNINSKWDVGVHGAVLHSWNSNQFDYSLGGDVGYLVMTNAWVSAGYNLVGFEDEDFSDANYTAEGPYVKFRMKFDQQSVKEAAEWLNK